MPREGTAILMSVQGRDGKAPGRHPPGSRAGCTGTRVARPRACTTCQTWALWAGPLGAPSWRSLLSPGTCAGSGPRRPPRPSSLGHRCVSGSSGKPCGRVPGPFGGTSAETAMLSSQPPQAPFADRRVRGHQVLFESRGQTLAPTRAPGPPSGRGDRECQHRRQPSRQLAERRGAGPEEARRSSGPTRKDRRSGSRALPVGGGSPRSRPLGGPHTATPPEPPHLVGGLHRSGLLQTPPRSASRSWRACRATGPP